MQVVIVVEGTSGIDFLFGIILAVVVANWVAGRLPGGKDGAYASELQREGGVTFLRPEPPHNLHHLSASDVSTHESPRFFGFYDLLIHRKIRNGFVNGDS